MNTANENIKTRPTPQKRDSSKSVRVALSPYNKAFGNNESSGKSENSQTKDQKPVKYLMLEKSTEIVLKNGAQKQIDELEKRLKIATNEIKSMNAYTKLKETEILLLEEKNSNEQQRKKLVEKDLEICQRDLQENTNRVR